MSATLAPPTCRVKAQDVAFTYPQNGCGLKASSLTVHPGDLLLISGSSGCGKSTLARCLTGLIPHLYRGALAGQVWLDGLLTADTPLWQLTERAGMVFQNPAAQMLAASVEEEIIFGLENLGLPPGDISTRLEAALARFELGPLHARSPYTLSGGEQQKLALAAMLARQPSVLVLDEPLSMLDSTAATALVADLNELAQQGASIVICEHRAEYLQHIPGLRTLHMDTPGQAAAQEAAQEAARENEHLQAPANIQTPPFCLHVRDLSVTLGQRVVLRDLNFSARGGQVVAVVGRNGVGKTTLLRAMVGLQKYQGRICVDEESPSLPYILYLRAALGPG